MEVIHVFHQYVGVSGRVCRKQQLLGAPTYSIKDLLRTCAKKTPKVVIVHFVIH